MHFSRALLGCLALGLCSQTFAERSDEIARTEATRTFSSTTSLISLNAETVNFRRGVWTGRFMDFAGKQWDVSHYYKAKYQIIRGNVIFGQAIDQKQESKKSKTVIFFLHRIDFDTGFKSALYQAQPFISWSPTGIVSLNERLSLVVGLHNLFSLGGHTRESPCFDDFRREFHCGTGIPWSDYPNKKTRYSPSKELQISVRYVF